MKELYNLGLNDNDIQNLIEIHPVIKSLNDFEIYNKIKILESIGCNKNNIENIILSNPLYLDRSDEDILSLIKILTKLNVSNLNLLFDSNPFLLNKDSYEIDEYINKEIKENKTLKAITDEIEINPYIIDENY